MDLIFAHAHQVALANPNESIDLYFVDDREDLIEGVEWFYVNYAFALPHNVKLYVVHAPFGKKPDVASIIQGKGNVNPHFDAILRATVQACKSEERAERKHFEVEANSSVMSADGDDSTEEIMFSFLATPQPEESPSKDEGDVVLLPAPECPVFGIELLDSARSSAAVSRASSEFGHTFTDSKHRGLTEQARILGSQDFQCWYHKIIKVTAESPQVVFQRTSHSLKTLEALMPKPVLPVLETSERPVSPPNKRLDLGFSRGFFPSMWIDFKERGKDTVGMKKERFSPGL